MDRVVEFLKCLQTLEWLQEKFTENPEKTLDSLGLILAENKISESANASYQCNDSAIK